VIAIIALSGLLFWTSSAAAVTLDPSIAQGIGLSDRPLEEIIVTSIQWLLGFLGLVAVIMIIVGGIRWTTAAGNEERVESAQSIIRSAVIGLVIIIAAWSIIFFVGRAVLNP